MNSTSHKLRADDEPLGSWAEAANFTAIGIVREVSPANGLRPKWPGQLRKQIGNDERASRKVKDSVRETDFSGRILTFGLSIA